ncbi:DNA-binding transcriptional regulator, ArsR family [Micromonospora siamensis]|uniref:DNA-binding transcriptional regulator, ArsR family n=2 Tax=Micromonospora siamensis TaxID=299152 RepID=A0A1C5GLX4_9ACTN|nr:DNA-binding transcriptional regulator, ArsR family [Micromonospora siamensis]
MSNIGYHAHMELHEPELRDVPVTAVLAALADDVRLRIVRTLAEDGERVCGTFELGVSKATRSHHFKVLREAGLTRTRVAGTSRHVRLRRDEIDRHYPGLLDAVLPDREPTNRAG